MATNNRKWLMQQSKPASGFLFLSVFLGIFSGLLIIAQSAILAFIIDRTYLHNASRHFFIPAFSFFALIILLRTITTYYREKIGFHTATLIKKNVRDTLFRRCMQSTPSQLAQHNTGALTTVLLEQVEALHGFFSDYLPQMTIAVLLPFIILGFVFSQNWLTGCILLFTAPLIPLFMALIGMGTAKLNQENFESLSRMGAFFLDRLQGLATLSLFNRARAQLESISTISNAFREKTMRVLRVAFLSSAALELFSTIAIAIIAVYLGLGLLGFMHVGFSDKHITLYHALFILLLAPEFFMPLRQLGTFYHEKTKAMGAADGIRDYDRDGDNHNDNAFGSACVSVSETLTLSNLSYTIDSKKILDNISLNISPGELITITGNSGAGKTTLLNLIAKFISPSNGKIIANNIDITQISDDNWRNHIAYLHQNPRLFFGTISDNIRIAKHNASQSEIEKAAEIAGVLSFASAFPDRLNTMINENNIGLSGGQIQRIALARIILKDAPLILLDEPTSFLDAHNAEMIFDLLEKWRGKKTILIATHDERIKNKANQTIAITHTGQRITDNG